jgi:hypothetical protein
MKTSEFARVLAPVRRKRPMGKYGEAAVKAAAKLRSTAMSRPPDAWLAAVRETFPHSPSSAAKGCPKAAFLGLCEEGLVSGAPRGSWTRSTRNKAYAVKAVSVLRQDPSWLDRERELWAVVSGPETKVENGQLDVVFSLWRAGLIAVQQQR